MVVFNKGLDGFFHSLIPVRLQESLTANTAEYIRARALSTALAISTFVPAVATLVIGTYHMLFNPDLLMHDAVSLAIALIFGIQAGFFYRFGNRWLSSAALTNTYFILIAILLITSGGITSPMKAILLTCPMIAFLVGGRQEGLQNTLITVLFILGLVTLGAIEFGPPNLFSKENPQMIFVVNWFGTVIIMAFCIMEYESELQNHCEASKTQRRIKRHDANSPSERFDIFINGLVPKTLRERLDPNTAGFVRVRTLSVMLLLATLMSLVSACILISVHLLFFRDQLKYDLIIVVITGVFGLQTWLFYKYNNFWLSALTLSYLYFILILLLVIISGGSDAPTMMLLLISPMVFFMLGGIQQGAQNAFFVMLIGLFFGVMKSIGFDFPNVFHAVSPTLIHGITFEITVISIVLCIMVYDTELQKRD